MEHEEMDPSVNFSDLDWFVVFFFTKVLPKMTSYFDDLSIYDEKVLNENISDQL